MNDDYLWDGSGEPDPEVQKLESSLGKLRHNRPAPAFPEIAAPGRGLERLGFLTFLRPRLKAAAFAWAAILVIVVAGLMLSRSKPARIERSEWNVTNMEGAASVGGETIHAAGGTENLGVGQFLETDGASKATLQAEATGEIELEPGTRLRLLSSRSGIKRLELERGTIHATIWAEPGKFVVDTPSATAVDLGCVYTLKVDDSGDGLLRTTLGWVGFKLGEREAFIPAGAACATKKKTGPGTPYFEDASDAFRNALAKLDQAGITQAGVTDDERAAALQVVLSQARERDALTLWHLLARVPEADRGRVYGRLAQLVPAPVGATRDGILRLDPQMLDLWWNELGFGDVSLWRHWERSWAQQQK
jgi:FecR protein